MPAIWIAAIQGLDPRMPTGAVVLSVHQAHDLVSGSALPLAVARAWIQGADVQHPDDATPEVQALAQRLRRMLPGACRPYEAKVAADFGLPRAGAAMASMTIVPTPAELADAVVDHHPDGVPRLSNEARLLRALSGL